MKGGEMLFSIITVVYNGADTIEKTITSVIKQSDVDIEYIIIDGGSTDGTLDVVKKYDEKISYWISEPDNGIYDAMNKGIRCASGEWVTFMNANDWYEPDAFAKIRAIIETCPADIIYGKVNKIEDGKVAGYMGIGEETDPKEIYAGNLYCHQGLFIKRKLFDQIGLYDCRYKIMADYEWILRAYEEELVPYFIDVCVANFTAGGISSSKRGLDENRIIIKQNYEKYIDSPKLIRLVGRTAFEYFCVFNKDIFADLLLTVKQLYIWGLGVCGKMCYELAVNLNCEVLGFIVSKAEADTYQNINVYTPQDIISNKEFIKNDMVIWVATEKYESEIIDILKSYGVPKSKYISMGSFFEVAFNEYMK